MTKQIRHRARPSHDPTEAERIPDPGPTPDKIAAELLDPQPPSTSALCLLEFSLRLARLVERGPQFRPLAAVFADEFQRARDAGPYYVAPSLRYMAARAGVPYPTARRAAHEAMLAPDAGATPSPQRRVLSRRKGGKGAHNGARHPPQVDASRAPADLNPAKTKPRRAKPRRHPSEGDTAQ